MRKRVEIRELNEIALDRFIERMSSGGCLLLLQWARRHAPHLLRMLMVAFLKGEAYAAGLPQNARTRSAKAPDDISTLEAAEREHIARALFECSTFAEAASKLGIGESTLWRKRKLYALG
jgi:transcriptional regulator of acetoin/glycerol metabolism